MTDIFSNRRFVLQYVIIGTVVIFIMRLFYLKVINKDYQQLAKSNVLRFFFFSYARSERFFTHYASVIPT